MKTVIELGNWRLAILGFRTGVGVVDGFACVRYISYDSKRTVVYGDAFIPPIRVARSRGQASFSNFGATGTTNSQSLRSADVSILPRGLDRGDTCVSCIHQA